MPGHLSSWGTMTVCSSRRRIAYWLRLGSAASLVAVASATQAADFTYRIEVAPGHTDNIRRVATDKEDETIISAGLLLRLMEQTRRTNLRLLSDLAYLDYLDDTYESQVIGNVAASGRYEVIEERLSLSFDDSFGQVRRDPTAAVTPSNRENVNYFMAGPDLRLPLGELTQFTLGGRYSIISYEESPLDSTRTQGSVGLTRSLSRETDVGLRATMEDVRFDEDSVGSQYDRYEYVVRYNTRALARTDLLLEVGYNVVEQEEQETDGVVARLNLNRRITRASSVRLGVTRELSSSGDLFRRLQNLNGVDLDMQPTQSTSDPFESTEVLVGYSFSRARTGFDITLSRFDEKYDLRPEQDHETKVVDLTARREITPTVGLNFIAQHVEEDFVDPLPDFRELRTTLSIGKRIGRLTMVSAQYTFSRRRGSLPGDKYNENAIWLRLAYGTALGSAGVGVAR
jgi:hypothetical protein